MNELETPTIYRLRHDDDVEWLIHDDGADLESLIFDGAPRANSWKPVAVSRLKSADGIRLKACDFPTGAGGLAMNQAAWEKMESYLAGYGEFLPLKCGEGRFWTFNVTHLVNALDEDASELVRSPNDGSVLMIRRHVFRPVSLKGCLLFKLSQCPRGSIYVTDPFVDLIKAFGLTGLDPWRVWPHRPGDVHRW